MSKTEQTPDKPQTGNSSLGVVRRSISELGRRGLTFNWGEMKPNHEYFISRDDIMSMDMLWFLNKEKIEERAKELSAETIMYEDILKDGWVIGCVNIAPNVRCIKNRAHYKTMKLA